MFPISNYGTTYLLELGYDFVSSLWLILFPIFLGPREPTHVFVPGYVFAEKILEENPDSCPCIRRFSSKHSMKTSLVLNATYNC